MSFCHLKQTAQYEYNREINICFFKSIKLTFTIFFFQIFTNFLDLIFSRINFKTF